MIEILITTKHILPNLRQKIVARPRLYERLRDAWQVPLTLISAPPGFGKTTVAYQAIRAFAHEDASLAWLTLDEYDNEPTRFWRYVCASLQTATDVLGADLLSQIAHMPTQALMGELLNQLTSYDKPLMLVIDDYHLIHQQEIHDSLAFLLEHLPEHCHIIIATRADPPLPLHRLRMRGQLIEVRPADLRFISQEASQLLNQTLALDLQEHEIEHLNQQTEGWVAGLHLAGLALANTPSDASHRHDLIERLAQSNRYIPEYLTEEVLSQQTETVRDFLLQTAILKRLCAPLCDAVTQGTDSANMLENLARQNLFITPTMQNEQGAWYRYHQLFADLIAGQLHQQAPERLPVLHQRASIWYETQGDIEPAIDHALQAGDDERAVQLFDAHAGKFAMQGRVLTIENWLKRLPEPSRKRLTHGHIAYGWALLLRGRYAEIKPHLQSVTPSLPLHDKHLQAEVNAILAAHADAIGQHEEAFAYAQRSLDLVEEGDVFTHAIAQMSFAATLRLRGDTTQTIAAYEKALSLCMKAGLLLPQLLSRAHLGYLYMAQGYLRQAEATTRPAIEAPVRHPAIGAVYVSLASVMLAQCRLEEAVQHIQQAIQFAHKSGHNATFVQAHVLLSQWHLAHDDVISAQSAFDRASKALAKGVPEWIETLYHAGRVHLWLAQGALDSAEAYLHEHGEYEMTGNIAEVMPMMWARLHYHQRHDTQAEAILTDVLSHARTHGRAGRVIEALTLMALVTASQGDEARSLTHLQEAIQIAEPEGYLQVFIAGGEAMAHLIRQIEGDYARQIFDTFPLETRQRVMTSADLPEPLTERELDILRLMARGLTYQQIADERFISINTVRHHIKSLYSKLHTDTRTRTLERARTLKLI